MVTIFISVYRLLQNHVQHGCFSAGKSKVRTDRKTIDAVIRNLEIIGEAANHIPHSIQEKYTQIPWSPIKGFLVHPA